MIEDMDLGIKIPATIIFTIVEKVLMVTVEVDIGIRPATLTPIIKETMLYCCFHLLPLVVFTIFFMEMKDVVVVVMM